MSAQEKIKRPVLHCVVMSLLSGMIYGYTTGIVAGIKEPAVNDMLNVYATSEVNDENNNWNCTSTNTDNLSESQLGLYYGIFTADILLGNLVGAYLGPWTSQRYGRRKAVLVNAILCIVTSLLMYWVDDYSVQVLLRSLQGISIGYCATVGPSYVSEISPPTQRGQLGTLFQLFICAFMALGMLLNLAFNPNNIIQCLPTFRWKLQLGMAAVPGCCMLLYGMCWMPESPAWLRSQAEVKAKAKAKANAKTSSTTRRDVSLSLPISSTSESTSLLEEQHHNATGVLGTIDETGSLVDHSVPLQEELSGWSMLCSRKGCKWLIIVITLPMAQQLTGINAIMFYGPTIISNMGFQNSLLVTFLVVGVWNLLSVFVSFVLVDRLGRRTLMMGTLFFMGVATTTMGILFHAFELGSTKLSPFIPLSMIMLFILAFESGPGPLFFVILNETFPMNIRKEAISLANMLQSGMNIVLSMSFPILIVALGDSGKHKNGTGTTFFILSGFVLLSILLVYMRVPETAATIDTDINDTTGSGQNDLLNERREFNGLPAVQNNLLETPAGVRWSPAVGMHTGNQSVLSH
jgi:MFS family permease